MAESSKNVAVKESADSTDIHAGWASFVNLVAEQKMTLASALEEASVTVRDRQIILSFTKQFSQQLVIRSMEVLAPLLVSTFGHDVSIETRLEHNSQAPKETVRPSFASASTAQNQPAPAAKPIDPGPTFEEVSSTEADDQVQKVLKYFPGKLKKETK